MIWCKGPKPTCRIVVAEGEEEVRGGVRGKGEVLADYLSKSHRKNQQDETV
jgi:hypothetical protein